MVAAPSLKVEVTPTQALPATNADSARILETPTFEAPMPKAAETVSVPQDQPQVKKEAVVPVAWQIGLLVIGLVSLLIMLALRRSAKQKWK